MRISLVHPLKHHAYKTAYGIKKSRHELSCVLGFYNKYNLTQGFNVQSKIINRLKGYRDERIAEHVVTSDYVNLLFLLTKFNNKFYRKFLEQFEKFALEEIKKADGIYFLQDYSQNLIDFARQEEKYIIYEQIMPCGYEQRELIFNECKSLKIDASLYTNKFFSQEKIELHYKNIRSADLIINASQLSHSVAQEALGSLERKNIILPYGSNPINVRDNDIDEYVQIKYSSIKNRKLKILYVGSLSVLKGTHYLIDLIEHLKHYNIEFGIVGLPNQIQDQIFLDKINNLNNVNYYGAIPHSKISKVYKEYDIFLLPSLVEGFGMVTLEAMSYGLPCIVNENCKSVVNNGYNGFIVEKGNTSALIDILKEVMDKKECIIELSKNAIQTSQEYTWDRYSDSLAALLNITFD
ncbi:glycosyltransferase family 4 protein [Priestia megaterium]|uniref:glycosyltransferase family 4 protein n=1 Tax=Priestia megaterium TaxID=1404 RepID=UPI003459746A